MELFLGIYLAANHGSVLFAQLVLYWIAANPASEVFYPRSVA